MSSPPSAESRSSGTFHRDIPAGLTLAESLMQHSIDGVLAVDLNCCLTIWTPGMERFSGLSSEQVLGKCAFDIFPFLKRIGEDKYVLAALAGEATTSTGRFYVVEGSQEKRYFDARYFPLRDGSGAIVGALGIVRDNTGVEAQIRRDLDESERRFRLLFEEAPIAYHEIDSDGIVRRVNRAECRLLGFQESEVIGHHASEFVAMDERDVSREAVRRKLSGLLALAPFQRDFVRRDGKRLTLEIHETLICDQHGAVVGIRSALLDITKRKHAEHALRKAHDQLEMRVEERTAELARANQALQNEIAERRRAEQRLSLQYGAVRLLSEADGIESAARSLLREVCGNLGCEFGAFFVVNRQSNLLRCDYVCCGPDGSPEVLQGSFLKRGEGLAGRVWQTGEPVWVSDLSARPDFPWHKFAVDKGIHAALAFPVLLGSEVFGVMVFCARAVQPPDKELLRSLALIGRQMGHFIQRHLLEEQLRQSQKMEAVGRLAGGVAHDFNNLLTIINGYGRMVLEELSVDNALRSRVQEILHASDRAATLTSQLLAFSRRQVFQPKLLELNHVISNMERMLRRVIGEHIELKTDLSPDLGCVKADSGQMEQVLMNMAVNSRDAMPVGGRLVISTAGVRRKRESPSIGAVEAPYVRLTISDTGVGMDENTRAHLFEPFFTTKERGKGTGLGLSTVYGIVQQHGGDIEVESDPGRGAKFEIFLPVSDDVRDAQITDAVAYSPARGTETILLVEDEAGVRHLAREILRRSGYRVLEAADGYEAIRLFREQGQAVDLLLTDVIMPLMSGRELAEQLMAMRKGIRVLYMSGYTDDVIAYCGELGPEADFMQKPFAPDVLARKVRAALDAQQRSAGTAN